MVRVRTIQIRLKRGQYERIKNDTSAKGFSSMSAYLRYLALDKDESLHRKVNELHAHLLGALKSGRKAQTHKVNPAAQS